MAKPKSKGKLASALSSQQSAHRARLAAQRSEQAQQDRAQAVKRKMSSGGAEGGGAGGGGSGGKAKKRRISTEGGQTTQGESHQVDKPSVQPFRRGERVLLVGEGNFSFSHSLLLPLSSSTSSTPVQPLITPSLLLCTAFDSQSVASEKYPDLSTHVDALRAAGATVLFGVDATKLEEKKEVREFAGLGKPSMKGKARECGGIEEGAGFDKIVFNFPHVGQGITDQTRNIRTNQTLLLDFYRSASLLLRRGTPRAPSAKSTVTKPSRSRDSLSPSPEAGDDVVEDDDFSTSLLEGQDEVPIDSSLAPLPPPPSTRGTLLLTLRTSPPYSLWLPAQLATKGRLLLPSILPQHEFTSRLRTKGEQPIFKTVRSWEFKPEGWQGYEHRRTLGFDEKLSSGRNEDLKLTAKERQAKKFGGAAVGGESKGEKAGAMRTWEFELELRQDHWVKKEKGGKGKKKGRADESEDDDLSDS
ncbi:hypothetical protein JCM11641_004775 [Rhodosporidiobolus odoratus]